MWQTHSGCETLRNQTISLGTAERWQADFLWHSKQLWGFPVWKCPWGVGLSGKTWQRVSGRTRMSIWTTVANHKPGTRKLFKQRCLLMFRFAQNFHQDQLPKWRSHNAIKGLHSPEECHRWHVWDRGLGFPNGGHCAWSNSRGGCRVRQQKSVVVFWGRTVACLAENVVSCFRLRKVFLDRGDQFRTSNVAWEFCYSMSFSETCGCVAVWRFEYLLPWRCSSYCSSMSCSSSFRTWCSKQPERYRIFACCKITIGMGVHQEMDMFTFLLRILTCFHFQTQKTNSASICQHDCSGDFCYGLRRYWVAPASSWIGPIGDGTCGR